MTPTDESVALPGQDVAVVDVYYDSLRLFSPARFSALPGMGLFGQTGPASATHPGSGSVTRRITRWLQRSLTRDPTIPAECRVPALAKR